MRSFKMIRQEHVDQPVWHPHLSVMDPAADEALTSSTAVEHTFPPEPLRFEGVGAARSDSDQPQAVQGPYPMAFGHLLSRGSTR